MNVTSIAAAAVSSGLAALTVGMGVARAEPAVPRTPAAAPWITQGSALASPPSPTGISWSWDWDDDDDDWSQTATWECPAGCSVTWEDSW